MASVEINGVTLEYNFLDADKVDVFVDEMQKVVTGAQGAKMETGKFKTVGDSIRYQIQLVETFFDTCFGNGTSAKIFPDNSDLKPRLEGFAAMRDLYNQSGSDVDAIVSRYSPNRVPNGQDRAYNNRPFQDHRKKKRGR